LNQPIPEAFPTFIQACLDDGWSIEPTYTSEDVKRAGKLEKDGFNIQFINRPEYRAPMNKPSISIWGPDGLALEVEETYSWENLQKLLRRCAYCNASGVETIRIGFAGRCCSDCRQNTELVNKIEYPGWTN
jgi:hypothetical protein